MKKIIIAIIMLLMPCIQVNALSIEEHFENNKVYINSNNVLITKENYDKIKDVLTEDEIENISQRFYEFINNSKYIHSNISKFIETIKYTNILGETTITNREITKEELEEIMSQPAIASSCVTGCWETTYKKIQLTASSNNDSNYINVFIENSWKKTPSNKSFDILGIRWSNSSYELHSYSGFQQYGSNDYIEYAMTSNNFKLGNFGLGLSQNLVDSASTYNNGMLSTLECSGVSRIYGTYQHAQTTLTLAESKSYVIAEGGLGSVLYFSNSTIRNAYDNMQGIYLDVTC